MVDKVNQLKQHEVKSFVTFCRLKGFMIISEGPKEFVFIAGAQGTQRLPIVPSHPVIGRGNR